MSQQRIKPFWVLQNIEKVDLKNNRQVAKVLQKLYVLY